MIDDYDVSEVMEGVEESFEEERERDEDIEKMRENVEGKEKVVDKWDKKEYKK